MNDGIGVAEAVRAARAALRRAEALLITAGAGMGVDSGLPDFRGDAGFWRAYPPFAKLGLSFVDLANPTWFHRDPALAWGFYGHRLHLYRQVEPHRGFGLLLELAQSVPAGAFVFTSNVDGQFQKAGFPEERLVECHGSVHHLQCVRPCSRRIWPAAETEIPVDPATIRAREPLPTCPECGELARPNILMFGDWSWLGERTQRQEEQFAAWMNEISGRRTVVVELGAGTAVPTVRLTSERAAQMLSARLIRINPREPRVPAGHISLPMPALEALTAVLE